MKTLELMLKTLNVQKIDINEMRTQNGGCSTESIDKMIDKFYLGGMKDKQLQANIITCIKKMYEIDVSPSDLEF